MDISKKLENANNSSLVLSEGSTDDINDLSW